MIEGYARVLDLNADGYVTVIVNSTDPAGRPDGRDQAVFAPEKPEMLELMKLSLRSVPFGIHQLRVSYDDTGGQPYTKISQVRLERLGDRVGTQAGGSQVIEQCEAAWEANKNDCNAFVKAVASHFGIRLTGQANDIVDQIQSGNWMLLSDGVEAANMADQGKLVIGGLKSGAMTPPDPGGHGHVVVVVSGPLAYAKYPSGYWGRLGGGGRKNITINYAWKAIDRDKVVYSAIDIATVARAIEPVRVRRASKRK